MISQTSNELSALDMTMQCHQRRNTVLIVCDIYIVE